MNIQLLFFAVLRDIVGTDQQALSLPEGTRAADLWQRLRSQHRRLQDYVTPPLTAINESYASPDTLLKDGDRVAFIPPVSGG